MEQNYPLLVERLQSAFIDTLFILILIFGMSSLLDQFENVQEWVNIVLVCLILLYEPICTTLGGTLGNIIKGIRIRKNSDINKRIHLLQALIRYPVKLFLGWVSFLTSLE